jgi:predicted nucleic acid-binding protein
METIIPIADTGFIVALLNRQDSRHNEVVPIYMITIFSIGESAF